MCAFLLLLLHCRRCVALCHLPRLALLAAPRTPGTICRLPTRRSSPGRAVRRSNWRASKRASERASDKGEHRQRWSVEDGLPPAEAAAAAAAALLLQAWRSVPSIFAGDKTREDISLRKGIRIRTPYRAGALFWPHGYIVYRCASFFPWPARKHRARLRSCGFVGWLVGFRRGWFAVGVVGGALILRWRWVHLTQECIKLYTWIETK
jgi:hypothetical protein